jgi:DNA topoisomerase-1
MKKRAIKAEKPAKNKVNDTSSGRGRKPEKANVVVKEEIKVKFKKQEDDDAEDDTHRWWLDQDRDNSIKWKTLRHNGVLFPLEYKPHGVPLIYDGKSFDNN